MNNTRKIESKLYMFFLTIKDSLEESYAQRAAKAALSVAELVGDAFNYVMAGVCNGKVSVPSTAKDLGNLIRTKVDYTLKDAYRSNKRTHGLRSVKPSVWLDETFDDGESSHSLMDRLTDWEARQEAQRKEREGKAARWTCEAVIKAMGMTARNQNIARELMIEGQKPEEVAAMFGIERNNCDAIAFRVRKALKKMGPDLFRKFYEEAA